jgi:heme oxygenase
MTFQEKLKQQTKELHDSSENHPFHVSLLKGDLPDQKYFLYLHNLFPITMYLEKRLNLVGELVRSSLLHNDIMQYTIEGCTLTSNDMHYFEWMNELGQKSDAMLLAVVYVEWLKDVYGGQMLSKHIKYNSALKYNNTKDTIMKIRSLLVVSPEDEDQFIFEVNKVYENHNKILDKIMKND